jgi:hypothetical protein
MGRTVVRMLLALLTAAMGFVIAACYGAMYAFQSGRVVDARSQQGLTNALVECRSGGRMVMQVEAGPDGSFELDQGMCDEILVRDANGQYRPQTVPVRSGPIPSVQMEPTK